VCVFFIWVLCVFCSHASPWKVGRAVWRYDEGWPSCSGTYWRLDRGVWIWRMAGLFWNLWKAWPRFLKVYEGRPTVLGQMEGLADMFEWIEWEAELFWDLSKAWPTCLMGLDERPNCFETYRGLGWRVWRGWMRARRVLRLMEGLTDVFKGVGWEADVWWKVELF